jgi:hypothetical protein
MLTTRTVRLCHSSHSHTVTVTVTVTVFIVIGGGFWRRGSLFWGRGAKTAANDRARRGNFDHTGRINFGSVFRTSLSDESFTGPY